MPGGYQVLADICNGQDTLASAASKGTSVTNANGAYGSWAQIVASVANDVDFVMIRLWPTNNSSQRTYYNIGTGAAGAEKILVNALYASSNTSGIATSTYCFPLSIPSGTRIAVQSQGQSTDSNNVSIAFFEGGFTQTEGYAGVDALSATETDTDPGGTAGTKGAYAQLVASTVRDYAGIMVCVGQNSTNNTAATSSADPTYIDVAVGAAGSEVIILPDFEPGNAGSGVDSTGYPVFLPIMIPAGTRVACRASSGNITVGTRVVGVMVYGVYQ